MNRLEDYDCITENENAVKEMDWWAGPFGKMALEIAKERGLLEEASMKYERLMRERRAQLAREADERMKASTAYALRFIFKERYKNGQ